MWIRTKDGRFYLCEIRGVVFATWVHSSEREHALVFLGIEEAASWASIIFDSLGLEVETAKVDL